MLTTVFVMQLVIIVLLVVGFIACYRKLTEKRVIVKCDPLVYNEKKTIQAKGSGRLQYANLLRWSSCW